jgi:hypothetical protein
MYSSVSRQLYNGVMLPTYPLGIHLTDIREPLCQGIARHLVTKLVFEIGGFGLGSLRKGPGIGD